METAKIRDGAYGNFVTGMGRRDTDKTENTFVNPYAGTDIVELARIKVQDGIAARIVECVPETAFKEPVTITGDSSGKVFKEASAVGLFEALQSRRLPPSGFSRLYSSLANTSVSREAP